MHDMGINFLAFGIRWQMTCWTVIKVIVVTIIVDPAISGGNVFSYSVRAYYLPEASEIS